MRRVAFKDHDEKARRAVHQRIAKFTFADEGGGKYTLTRAPQFNGALTEKIEVAVLMGGMVIVHGDVLSDTKTDPEETRLRTVVLHTREYENARSTLAALVNKAYEPRHFAHELMEYGDPAAFTDSLAVFMCDVDKECRDEKEAAERDSLCDDKAESEKRHEALKVFLDECEAIEDSQTDEDVDALRTKLEEDCDLAYAEVMDMGRVPSPSVYIAYAAITRVVKETEKKTA